MRCTFWATTFSLEEEEEGEADMARWVERSEDSVEQGVGVARAEMCLRLLGWSDTKQGVAPTCHNLELARHIYLFILFATSSSEARETLNWRLFSR